MPVDWGELTLHQEDLGDLATFFGLTRDECRRRVEGYESEEMAEAWIRANPLTSQEMREFYGSTELYIWELSRWHGSEAYQPYLRALDRLVREWPPSSHRRVLDYGCGIGTAAIHLAERGYQVTIADVPGKTLDFATHRFGRRGLPVQVFEITDDFPRPKTDLDILICFDVLEHVPAPDRTLFRLADELRCGGVAAIVASFFADKDHPHHLQENVRYFGTTGNWQLTTNAAGLDPLGNTLYRKVKATRTLVRRLRYHFWRKTGLFLALIPRSSDEGYCLLQHTGFLVARIPRSSNNRRAWHEFSES